MRRLGCGCLSIIFLVAFLIGGVGWMAQGLFKAAELQPVIFTPADGVNAQQKIYEMVGRGPGGKRTPRSVALSEQELNAFLARHLAEIADMPVMGAIVHLRVNDVFDLAIRLPTRVLLAETPLSSILDLSPPRWVDRPVWLRLRARTQVEPAPSGQRRFLRLDVERLYLGRTRLPAVAHRLLLSPMALKLLLWPLPAGIDDIRVERQQVVIRGGG
ncbi:MAG: hypothetical protein DME08_18710 [Candidatus Rokuibacteriota bacterium]|nr:MAG: hypothetical protein DME08_18710 [Candidatus Rokubacteria bacterium]